MPIYAHDLKLNVGEKIVDPNGATNSRFKLLWQRLVGNGGYLNDVKFDSSRQIIAGDGLTGGGDLTEDRTLAIDLPAEAERIRDVMGAALVAGANITITVNDPGDTITIASTGGGSGGSWIPLVDGSEPPTFITDGMGQLVLVAYD